MFATDKFKCDTSRYETRRPGLPVWAIIAAMSARPSYRERVLQLREDAIVDAVNRLLATKGYDLMTVAAESGIAKASLYRHFTSKEELAAAAMVRALDRALALVAQLRAAAEAAPLDRLKAVVGWAIRCQLDGEMPVLPSQNSSLTESLKCNEAYMDRLVDLSSRLGTWITEAQTGGHLSDRLPADLVLYTLFARACDPVVGLLKASGQYADAQIVDWITSATFDGLRPR